MPVRSSVLPPSPCHSHSANEDRMPTDEKPGGPASFFPSIEKKYGQPIEHWLELCGTSRG